MQKTDSKSDRDKQVQVRLPASLHKQLKLALLQDDSSLADLYDVNSMPSELRKAHKNLDKAVLKLYGLKPDTDEMNIVKHLLMLYKIKISH